MRPVLIQQPQVVWIPQLWKIHLIFWVNQCYNWQEYKIRPIDTCNNIFNRDNSICKPMLVHCISWQILPQQRNYDHIFASIPVYDGSNREDFFPWLDRLEAACYHCGREHQNGSIRKVCWTSTECHYGPSSEQAMVCNKRGTKTLFLRSDFIRSHSFPIRKLDTKPNEPLRLYIYRYSKLHKAVTQKNAAQDTDPSRWFRFLTSITNTSIADKVTRSKTLPHNFTAMF